VQCCHFICPPFLSARISSLLAALELQSRRKSKGEGNYQEFKKEDGGDEKHFNPINSCQCTTIIVIISSVAKGKRERKTFFFFPHRMS
jgi:hypothetical protein